MNDTLRLQGLEVSCIIGDLPAERHHEQVLTVDVSLLLDLRKAAASDALSDTVDYATLVEEIRSRLRAEKCRLLERAAHVVAEVCLCAAGVRSATICVTKREVIPGLRAAVVEITRTVEDAR
ncbi:MAG: dihydroneopterin aldolase [Kiritimatiellae bacterium]|nr:dihydroneopterin aldolase [Kiritimatiellia bacterium]